MLGRGEQRGQGEKEEVERESPVNPYLLHRRSCLQQILILEPGEEVGGGMSCGRQDWLNLDVVGCSDDSPVAKNRAKRGKMCVWVGGCARGCVGVCTLQCYEVREREYLELPSWGQVQVAHVDLCTAVRTGSPGHEPPSKQEGSWLNFVVPLL